MTNLITPKKPNLVLLTGGTDGDGDYLTPLPIGTKFLAKKESSMLGYDLQMWTVVNKSRRSRLLTIGGQPLWVQPFDFCQKNKLIEVLDDNWTDRPGDLEPATADQHKLDVDA